MTRDATRPRLQALILLALSLLICRPQAVRGATPQQVQQAIEKAQKFLLDHRGLEGTWEVAPKPQPLPTVDGRIISPNYTQWGGYTAVATYALLASGIDARAKEMDHPLHFLLNANLQSTYSLGLSSQIVAFLPEKDTREFVKRNVALLTAGMNAPPPNALRSPKLWGELTGFYGYWVGVPTGTGQPEALRDLTPVKIGTAQPVGWFDRSNSQYAILGMWALDEAGGETRNVFWQIADVAWKKAQLREGGWNYTTLNANQANATASMTAAGVATLFITQDYTTEENWAACRGGIRNEFIERGLHWMDEHIEAALGGEYYTMYGVERIGTASGRKYFGTKDWYQIGADYLVKHQNADGSWAASWGAIPETSFGLLFLARGRAPVLMNKLEYEGADRKVADPWNERPRDVANLARWTGHQEESYYNWQVVNLRTTPEEWHDAPILYISGAQALAFTPEQEARLRTFVQEGGMILGNADCGREIFAKTFQDLGRNLFPKAAWRPTPPGDFIYNEQFKEFRVKPKVLELTNNVRKLMVLLPEVDAARAWQTNATKPKGELFGLGANIFLYATDKKNLLAKGDTYWVTPNPTVQPVATLKVARLDVGEDPDPEPAGWTRVSALLHNRYRLDLRVDIVKPEAVAGHDVADLTGTGSFTLTAAQRAALKQFVARGGTLIVDAAGGDVAFADAAENELAATFGAKPQLIDASHLVFNYPGNRIDHIGWRAYAAERVADKRQAKLRGMNVGRRTAVFFSREDLAAGMVGEPVDGVLGYDPATATALMEGMLLYAQSGGVPPPTTATAPTTAPATAPTTVPSTAPAR